MKLHLHVFAALIALTGPAVVQADTVFYSTKDGTGIKSISGTIINQSSSSVEITTYDGETVSIPGDDVYQIIRDKSTAEGKSPFEENETSKSSRNDHYGIKGGMNISNMSADPQELEDDDSLKSYAFGAWYGLPLTRRLSFQTEALYSVKGDAESSDGYTASTKVSYLDVPVLAKMGFLHGGSFQPSLFLGPSMALNLSAKSTFEGGGSDIEVDVKDQMRKFELGLVVGGGVDFPVRGRNFGVELRYSKGLSNAAGDDANGSAHNDVLAVMGSVGLQ